MLTIISPPHHPYWSSSGQYPSASSSCYTSLSPFEDSPTPLDTQIFKGKYNLKWRTHKPHMHQPMKINGWELPKICQKVHCNTSYIYIGPPKVNTNINLSLLNLSPPYYHPPTNNISNIILKHMENLPCSVLIKPTQCPTCYLNPLQFSEPHHPLYPLSHYEYPTL